MTSSFHSQTRRTSSRNRGSSDPIRRSRCAGDRFGRGARASCRARRRNGRLTARTSGAPDVASAKKAYCRGCALEYVFDLYQPDPRKDRRDVWKPRTTSGGRALKFYSSVRLEIRRTSSIKDGDSAVGNRTKVKVVKNKVAPPLNKEAEFDIMYGEGISHEGDLLDLAVENRIVERAERGSVLRASGLDRAVRTPKT